MFPSELELEMHRREMRRAADNHRLVQSIREENGQPTLWQRLRTRLNAAKHETVQSQGRAQKRPTEAIA